MGLNANSVSALWMSDSLTECGKKFLEQTQSYVSALFDHHHAIAPKPGDGGQSLHRANLEYLLRGSAAHSQAIQHLVCRHDEKGLLNQFDSLRDAISLMPRNPYAFQFLAELLNTIHPGDCAALRALCKDRTVVLHVSCRSRLSKARESKASFKQQSVNCVHVVVVGVPGRTNPPKRLGFRFRKGAITLASA